MKATAGLLFQSPAAAWFNGIFCLLLLLPTRKLRFGPRSTGGDTTGISTGGACREDAATGTSNISYCALLLLLVMMTRMLLLELGRNVTRATALPLAAMGTAGSKQCDSCHCFNPGLGKYRVPNQIQEPVGNGKCADMWETERCKLAANY